MVAQYYGNVHFACVARLVRGEALVVASHSNNSETDLEGKKIQKI